MHLVVAFMLAVQQTPSWTVGPQPTVRIGEVEGEEHYMFSQVASAIRLSNGRIVVANSASNEVRVYDAKGKHISTHGRAGGGPGEFQSLRAVWLLANDTIMAMDSRNGRLTLFGPAMQIVRTETLPPIPGAIARMANGSYLATQGLAPPDKRPMNAFHGMIDFEGLVLRRAPGATATVYDTIVRGVKAGQSYVNPESKRQYPFPYARSAQIGIGRTHFVYGSTHSTDLGVYDQTGKPTGTIKIRGSSRPLSTADIDKWVEDNVGRRTTAEQKLAARNDYKAIPPNPRTPEFAALKIDDLGNVWVRQYGPPWDPSPNWDVYDIAGKSLARVRMPARFEPMHIGRDFVVGVSRDEFDVERVELYSLRRS